MRRYLPGVALLLASPAFAVPKTKPAPVMPAAADISAVKDKLTVWSDGKKHFIAWVLTTNSDSPIFWSNDGKSFFQLRIHGGGSEGDDADLKKLGRNFWEPPFATAGEAQLAATADTKKADLQCTPPPTTPATP